MDSRNFSEYTPEEPCVFSHRVISAVKGCELFRLPQVARAKSFQRRDQNLLGQVVRGMLVSQVTQAVEPDARSHPAEKLSLGLGVAGTYLRNELSVVQLNNHQYLF